MAFSAALCAINAKYIHLSLIHIFVRNLQQLGHMLHLVQLRTGQVRQHAP